MFRNRNNSQKPNDELLAAFKQNFPGVTQQHAPTTASKDAPASRHHGAGTSGPGAPLLQPTSRRNAHGSGPDGAEIEYQHVEHEQHSGDVGSEDITPSRFTMDQWRLTPSIFDANAFAIGQMGNAHIGYYTPTPGGANTVYHNETAGDLHTPSVAFQLGTPLSMPLADNPLHPSAAFDHSFSSHIFSQQGFDSSHIFSHQNQHGHQQQMLQQQPQQQQQQQQQQQHAQQPQQLVPPSMLIHKDSGIGGSDNSPVPGMTSQCDNQAQGARTAFGRDQAAWTDNPSLEEFRYHLTLNAPTAMIRTQSEVPITYLNKGQAYTLSIIDSLPVAPPPRRVKYRTMIRVSFEDEEQRTRPSQCWQLWKEGRGLAESHQRSGKLQAVEYVDPHPGAADDDPRKPRIVVERESFDGFSVTWSPAAHATSPNAECSIAVRFNFLSTDFSHSKGVKGIPVRLCAKTYMLAGGDVDSEDDPFSASYEDAELKRSEQPADAEVVYCKVKLFRDHGAERKLTNDVAHVRKSMEKMKSQIQQMESGIKETGRRKRTSMSLGKTDLERPAKVPKHKRTWSVSSTGSGGGTTSGGAVGKTSAEEDLNEKLASMQEMFSSTRSVSVLFLRGDPEDDMDKYPVALPGEGDITTQSVRQDGCERKHSREMSPSGSMLGSPVVSTRGVPGTVSELDSFAIPAVPTKVQRGSASFDAIDVDPAYVPPPTDVEKAVACVYMKRDGVDIYYRAIYLWSRTLDEFAARTLQKFGITSRRAYKFLRITGSGIEVEFDDEMVEQLDEGQDITLSLADDAEHVKTEASGLTDSFAGQAQPLIVRLCY